MTIEPEVAAAIVAALQLLEESDEPTTEATPSRWKLAARGETEQTWRR